MKSLPSLQSPASEIQEKLSRVPPAPGVYIMKDAQNNAIYVGKARNLKKRLSSYFSATRPLDIKTAVLIRRIADFETIITGTEKEALILESNLIKRHKPHLQDAVHNIKNGQGCGQDKTPRPCASGIQEKNPLLPFFG